MARLNPSSGHHTLKRSQHPTDDPMEFTPPPRLTRAPPRGPRPSRERALGARNSYRAGHGPGCGPPTPPRCCRLVEEQQLSEHPTFSHQFDGARSSESSGKSHDPNLQSLQPSDPPSPVPVQRNRTSPATAVLSVVFSSSRHPHPLSDVPSPSGKQPWDAFAMHAVLFRFWLAIGLNLPAGRMLRSHPPLSLALHRPPLPVQPGTPRSSRR